MKTTPLNTALIAAGVLAVGTAGAFTLRPDLLDKARAGIQPAAQPAADVQQVAALAPTAAPAPVPMTAGPAQTPNYRAIVQQFGPAVVGITVAGTHQPRARRLAAAACRRAWKTIRSSSSTRASRASARAARAAARRSSRSAARARASSSAMTA